MGKGLRLEVLICTCGKDGLSRVAAMNLPHVDGVGYVVSWQPLDAGLTFGRPEALERDDVKVFVSPTRGLSLNRNAALSHASAELCLVADDDLRYTAEQLESVIVTFDMHPRVDIATFMYDGGDEKYYPSEETDLSGFPKNWYLTSFEMAFRRKSMEGLRWNELFGIGAPVLSAGEESLLIWQAVHRGLTCRFFPKVIVGHEGLTTGVRRVAEPSVLMAKGAVWWVTHRYTGPLRIVLNAWREKRAGRMGFFHALRHCWRGYCYGAAHLHTDGTIKH